MTTILNWILKKLMPTSSSIVKVAQTQVGIRETSKNQGPGIEKYWAATTYPTGYANREPYCAAFVCWVIREALGTTPLPLPRSPVAYDFEKWGASNPKYVSVFRGDYNPKPGDIFTLATASHVGIVKAVLDTTIITLEANTDGSGSREGDGVYERTRSRSSIRKLIRICV